MATKKPISTISYNSESFLKEKLDGWVDSHLIQSYMYICHKGEDGDKNHIHLRIEPNKSLDPMDLSDALQEWQVGKEKPLGVRPWRPSKEEDWLLYAVHDVDYLRVKYQGGESREKLPYTWHDIKANENFDVETAYIRARATLRHTGASIVNRLRQGESPVKLIEEGLNIYSVNGITRAMAPGEIDRLQRENNKLFEDYCELRKNYDKLNENLHGIVNALLEWGFVLSQDKEGDYILDETQPYAVELTKDFIEKK